MPRPPFASSRWRRRASHAFPHINGRVWFDPDNGYEYEYEPDPTPAKSTWHEINPRTKQYREIDGQTGLPVAGAEGQWRPLR